MDHPAVDLLSDWFNRGQSGCKFASRLASGDPRLAFFVHLGPVETVDLDDVDSQIEANANNRDVSLLVFPRASSEREIIDLALHLQGGRRWLISSRACPSSQSTCGLTIEYRTEGGALSSAMGFAPSGTMPVTRRAPFTALALWAGGPVNPFFTYSPAGTVNMADVPTDLSRAAYDKTWTSSVEGTKRRLHDPRHDSVWLRRVAFCLARELVEPHWAVPTQ